MSNADPRPRPVPLPALLASARNFELDLEAAIDVAMAPISEFSAFGIHYALGKSPTHPNEYIFAITAHPAKPPTLGTCWRMRADLVDRVGTDEPLLVLQEFAQEVGEIVKVGDQRNRFIYSETIPMLGGLINMDAVQVVGQIPGEIYVRDFQGVLPKNVSPPYLDLRYAFAIARRRYLAWLAQGSEPRTPYASVFISYGEPDVKFALRLCEELTRNGVDCWLYKLDATLGQRSWHEITTKIHERDRTIIICSEPALTREGTLKEIETAIDHDPEKIICVSIDSIWQEEAFAVQRGTRNLKPHLIERNYADFSKKRRFAENARGLLKALEKPTA